MFPLSLVWSQLPERKYILHSDLHQPLSSIFVNIFEEKTSLLITFFPFITHICHICRLLLRAYRVPLCVQFCKRKGLILLFLNNFFVRKNTCNCWLMVNAEYVPSYANEIQATDATHLIQTFIPGDTSINSQVTAIKSEMVDELKNI